MYWKVFSSILGLDSLDAGCLALVTVRRMRRMKMKMRMRRMLMLIMMVSPDIAKGALGGKTAVS